MPLAKLELTIQYTSPTPIVLLHLIPRIQFHPGIPLPCSQGLVKIKTKKKPLLRLSLASFSPHHYSWRQRSPFHLFITHQKLLNALISPKSKKVYRNRPIERASERVPFSTSYLQLALAHARNSRVNKCGSTYSFN